MKTTILCFSGSGNSYWVASQLATQLGDATVLMIPSLMEADSIELGQRVGIVYPAYKFFPPNLATFFVETVLSEQNLDGVASSSRSAPTTVPAPGPSPPWSARSPRRVGRATPAA